MAALRICIFTETYHPLIGGGETQARSLAEGLAAQDHEIIIITRRSYPSLKKIEHYGKVTVYRISPFGIKQLKKWSLLITSLPTLLMLRRNYDLIFVSGFRIVGISAVLISKLLGKTCILKADSLGEMSGDIFTKGLARLHITPAFLPFRMFLLMRNVILKYANAFVAISSPIETELVDHNVSHKVIRMIPNSVDTIKFCPVSDQTKRELRLKLDLSQKNTIVTFTGRLVSYKGLPLLLRVWRKICHRYTNAQLLLVGCGGLDIHNCESELKGYVQKNGLHAHVLFTGAVDNVYEYLQASDFFVFPTEKEAFGISLIEAMACGLPIISTAVGGLNDIIRHGQNGIVVEPTDFRQLYDAITLLMSDHSLSISLGETARETARDKYTSEIIIQKYSKLFKEVREENVRVAARTFCN